MPSRTYDQHTIETSNEDKILFTDCGVTKGDLIDYYARIAETMLPHLRGRPLTMQRFPDGIERDGFYQKDASDYFPEWIDTVRLAKRTDGSVDYVVCGNTATLAYLANQAMITPHVWLSRRDSPEKPDRIVWDLDPPGDDFATVVMAAQWLTELLDELALPVFLQLTGSRGIHVVTPIDRGPTFEDARSFARRIAELLSTRHPDRLTVEQRKKKRRGRLYIDTGRNAYGQTIVPPYSVRAREGAPVATPIERRELGRSDLAPRKYTLRNLFRRLGQRDDPWRAIDAAAASLGPARDRLRAQGVE